jgi:uncharacterized protein
MIPGFEPITLITVAFIAATVNGALGYGFSSLTVPVALLLYSNRVLNPALVLVEVVLNSYALLVNWRSVPRIGKRVLPILCGLIPGVLAGSYALSTVRPEGLRLLTYVVLLPLILLQAAGVRRPVRAERMVGAPFGAVVGVLYSVTTISGPPLALLLNNQGVVKHEFRAGLSLIRVVESTATAIAYYALGVYSAGSTQIMASIIPSVAVGIPLGAYIIRRLDAETFRRMCMSFDAWVVGFGLSRVAIELRLVASPAAYAIWMLVVLVDLALLRQYFGGRRQGDRTAFAVDERSGPQRVQWRKAPVGSGDD